MSALPDEQGASASIAYEKLRAQIFDDRFV
jgi:hypothetical protein